jgi:hypothetical protein
VEAFVVRDGPDSCPVGCGGEVILVRCLPSGRLAGWCWACEVSLPIPLPADFRLTNDDIGPARYAPCGLGLPEWSALAAAGLSAQVVRRVPAAEWSERLGWAHKARQAKRCTGPGRHVGFPRVQAPRAATAGELGR